MVKGSIVLLMAFALVEAACGSTEITPTPSSSPATDIFYTSVERYVFERMNQSGRDGLLGVRGDVGEFWEDWFNFLERIEPPVELREFHQAQIVYAKTIVKVVKDMDSDVILDTGSIDEFWSEPEWVEALVAAREVRDDLPEEVKAMLDSCL